MGLLDGKEGLIVGMSTERAISWGIAQALRRGHRVHRAVVDAAQSERCMPSWSARPGRVVCAVPR
jgi:enoyl-[acyl-carrier-protein] reductase (NADH)